MCNKGIDGIFSAFIISPKVLAHGMAVSSAYLN